jgi:hypothetical protein
MDATVDVHCRWKDESKLEALERRELPENHGGGGESDQVRQPPTPEWPTVIGNGEIVGSQKRNALRKTCATYTIIESISHS